MRQNLCFETTQLKSWRNLILYCIICNYQPSCKLLQYIFELFQKAPLTIVQNCILRSMILESVKASCPILCGSTFSTPCCLVVSGNILTHKSHNTFHARCSQLEVSNLLEFFVSNKCYLKFFTSRLVSSFDPFSERSF